MYKQIITMYLAIMFVVIVIPAHQSLARSKPAAQSMTSSTLQRYANPTEAIVQKAAQPTNGEEIVTQAEKGLDRSISILNIVATLMGVLVALIAVVLALAAALGFFEYRKWKSLRKEAEKHVKEIKDSAATIKPIVDKIKKAEEEINQWRDKIKSQPLTEAPTEELKSKLDEYGKKIELLEAFGMPLKPEDYFNHGLDLYYKGKYELALEAFNKAIELKPNYANAWHNKGVTLGTLGRNDDALQAYNKAIELKPDFANAWDNKGVTLGTLGRNDDALQAHNKAIELKPDFAYAWDNKGVALSKLGRNDEALQANNRAIELKPDYTEAWYNRACIYALKADKHNAFINLSKAIGFNSVYKEQAKTDKDFQAFWNDEDFKKIVG